MAVALEEILEAHAALPASRVQAGKMPAPLSSGLLFRQLAPQSSEMCGSLSLQNWPCLSGPGALRARR
jgi:hypothetical protein